MIALQGREDVGTGTYSLYGKLRKVWTLQEPPCRTECPLILGSAAVDHEGAIRTTFIHFLDQVLDRLGRAPPSSPNSATPPGRSTGNQPQALREALTNERLPPQSVKSGLAT